MTLRLATYNIHRCVGCDGHCDPDRILGVIREMQLDVLALQEVESCHYKGEELLEYLGRETGMHSLAGPTLLRGTRSYGNALLSRMPVRDVRRLDLSFPGREPRGALDIDLELNGSGLQLVATHLGLNPAERRVQVQQLLELFRGNGSNPAVLIGDLNEWFLWGRPLHWLQGLFGKTPAPATFPAKWPMFALDRIWVRPHRSLIRVEVHDTPLARQASDHLPLKAMAEW